MCTYFMKKNDDVLHIIFRRTDILISLTTLPKKYELNQRSSISNSIYWWQVLLIQQCSKIHRNLSPLTFFIHVKWRTIYIQCFLVDLFSRPCTYGSHPIIRFYFSFWQEENLNLHNFCQIPLQWILHDCIEYIDRYN